MYVGLIYAKEVLAYMIFLLDLLWMCVRVICKFVFVSAFGSRIRGCGLLLVHLFDRFSLRV